MMRVTPQMMSQKFIKNTERNNSEIAKIQQQISSGRKIEKISDNPSDALKGLSYRSSLIQIEQYQKNVQDGIGWLTATDDALGNATTVLQRIRELMVQAGNDTVDENTRKNIGSELSTLKEQLGNIANTTFGGKYIFAGKETTSIPYENGVLSTVGQSEMIWTIGQGQNVNINASADSVFWADSQNIFATLDTIISDLEQGKNPNSYLKDIDQQMDNVLTQRTVVGANHNRFEMAANKLDQADFLTQKLWSEKEGTDVAKAYMELSAQESTLKASYNAGAKIMQVTLADFLR
jgi:flagellar hook-associated protein 3 FlgL